jgi:NADH-quinone oxidoreductase subunit D
MEHSYVLAIEKLLGLEVPLRAQYLRVLWAEMTRIKNHLLNIGSHVMDVGAMTPNLWLFEPREDIMNFYERVSGARMHANYFRPGGVHQDVPAGLLDDIGAWLDTGLMPIFNDAISLVADNRIFKQRNVDISIVSKEDALAWGFSGPMIRAAGIPWDIRKSQPLRSLRPDGVRRAGGHARRLLRPDDGAGGRGPPVGADHETVPRPDARGSDRLAWTARWCRPSAPR